MLRLNLPVRLLTVALGLGLMGGVLLAQQTEQSPLALDCSSENRATLMRDVSERFPIDFARNPAEATANLYRRSLVYQQIILDCGALPPTQEIPNPAPVVAPASAPLAQPVGTDPLVALAQIEGLTGDAAHGAALFNGGEQAADGSVLGCSSCHTGGSLAPDTTEIWTNTVSKRLVLPRFSTYTAEQYIVESIIQPEAYGSAGYMVSMPHDFGERLVAQDLADIVAYLRTLSTASQ